MFATSRSRCKTLPRDVYLSTRERVHGQILNKMDQRQLRAIYLYEQKIGTSSKDASDRINIAEHHY